jgi:hypothetical protein
MFSEHLSESHFVSLFHLVPVAASAYFSASSYAVMTLWRSCMYSPPPPHTPTPTRSGAPAVGRLCVMRDICVFYSQRLPALKNANTGLFAPEKSLREPVVRKHKNVMM